MTKLITLYNGVILIIKNIIVNAKFTIIRSKYIRNNLSVFYLYLVHDHKLKGITRYKMINRQKFNDDITIDIK